MPFQVVPDYTAIAIAYKNGKMIADGVSPRRPVKRELFDWDEYDVAQAFNLVDDTVGRTSAPNKIEYTTTRKEATTTDHALDSPVPNSDVENAAEGQDPMAQAVMLTMNTVKLNREKRVADIAFNAASYVSDYVVTLGSSTDQFDDYTNSDPGGVILPLLDKCLVRPNLAIFGRSGWTKFRRNPKVIADIRGQVGDTKNLTIQDVADWLEVDEILVGEARGNMALKGQPVDIQRLWGNHIAFHYRSPLGALTQGEATFMLTAQFGQQIAGTIEDGNIGMRGGRNVRAGEAVRELVIAPFAGAFIENAFS